MHVSPVKRQYDPLNGGTIWWELVLQTFSLMKSNCHVKKCILEIVQKMGNERIRHIRENST